MTRAGWLLAALVTSGCTGTLVGPDPHPDGAEVFESVWRDVDRHYGLFDSDGVNWDSLHGVYAAPAAVASTDRALAATIGALLLELRDLHVDLHVPGLTYRYAGYDVRPHYFDPAVVQAQYVPDRTPVPGGHLSVGHIAPGIGYVWIPSFDGTGFGAELDAALRRLSGIGVLIMDVRDNGGGDNANGREVAARFADRPYTFGYVRFRNGPRHGDFTAAQALVVSPAGTRFTGSVVVLTNRDCYSATEDFVLAMSALPHVMVVGDSTGGASGYPIDRELTNGWTYRFSEGVEFSADHRRYEVTGLAPQLFVRGSSAALAAGDDVILDSAVAVARRLPPIP